MGLIQIEEAPGVRYSVFGVWAEPAPPNTEHRTPNTEYPLALYVHIPFCVRKCFYCDFNSGPSQAEQREEYVELLCREIRQSAWAGSTARTVFFGGGTPSELSPGQLGRINDQLRETFRFPVSRSAK